ncbi:MAG: glycoside hydrolase family 15 protein [Terracidiphilus sp.]
MHPASFLTARTRAAGLCAALFAALPAGATNLVTGNGFGFAVVSPQTATITKFYSHPYSFMRPDPHKPLSEGIATPNFIKSLRWTSATGSAPAEYVDDSQVIRVGSSNGEGFAFMPFGPHRAALIVAWQQTQASSPRSDFQVEWSAPIASRVQISVAGNRIQQVKLAGIEESLLAIPLAPKRNRPARAQQFLTASSAWAFIPVEHDSEVQAAVREFIQWRSGLTPAALVRREIAEIEQWRVKPAFQFASEKQRHLWRQSEIMLRIAQSREPNHRGENAMGRYGNGLIVASLPDGVWFTPWVRDMSWATVAMARMGHQAEARAALLAYFNARPVGKMRQQTAGADYQVSVVRYFGDGAEEPFFTEEGSTNIEFDDWGEVLWALGEYMRRFNDSGLLNTPTARGTLYRSARDFIVGPLRANLEKYGDGAIVAADTSIWEERQKDKKHFAFSTAMAIVGFRNFAEVARRAGDERSRTEALACADQLQRGFNAAFIRGGRLHGTLEPGVKNDIDGALLPIINSGVVTDPAVIRNTIERMELLKVASGGYRRVRSTYTDPAIFEYWYERQEFLFVDFSLAELDRRLGRKAEADRLIARIVDKAAADHDIIPEMYVALPCPLFPGAIGDPTGARPMVGYGAGVYILDVLDSAACQ